MVVLMRENDERAQTFEDLAGLSLTSRTCSRARVRSIRAAATRRLPALPPSAGSSHPACYAMAGSELACGAAEYAMSGTDHRERCKSWHMELRALRCPVLSW
eukprot:1718428-Rhodomonas_salina.2